MVAVMKPFVLMITFLGVTVILLMAIAAGGLQQSNRLSSMDDPPTGMEAILGWEYTMKVPKYGNNITWANATTAHLASDSGQPHMASVHSTFYDFGTESATDRHAIHVFFVRNETWPSSYWPDIFLGRESSGIRDAKNQELRDFVCFVTRETVQYDFIGGTTISVGVVYRYHILPYEVIDANKKGNQSIISFTIGNRNMTAFFVTSTNNMTRDLFINNSFCMGIGTSWGDVTKVGKSSMWSLVHQLLTGDIPETNFWINKILQVSLWAIIIFVAVAMISAFIPTVPGMS